MRSAASQGRAGRRAERRDRWDALSSSRPFLSTRECRRVASARRRRRCSRAKAARTRKQARQAVRSEVGQGSWPGSLAVRLAEGTRARDEAAIPALRVGVHGAGNGWDENRRPLDVIAKTSESGAAMVGCPRYLYFYIRPGCLPPQSPAVSSSRQAACLVRPPPSRKGMETVSTLGQGAESSWATPKGRYAWSGGVTEEAAGREVVAGQDRTGGRRLLRGRWLGKMAGCPSGWQIDPTRRTAWFGLAGRITGPWTQRNVAVCLVGLPPLIVLFSTGRPAMGIRHHQHTPPRSPGFGPMPTLQPAHLAAQRKNGTPRPRRDRRRDGQHGRGGPTRGGPFSTQPGLRKACVLHGHWPQHTGARQHSSRRPAAWAGGHSRGFDSDQPEFAAQQCFFCPGPTSGDIQEHHQHLSGTYLGSSRLASLRSWLLASQSMQLRRVHTRPRETRHSGTDGSRIPTPALD